MAIIKYHTYKLYRLCKQFYIMAIIKSHTYYCIHISINSTKQKSLQSQRPSWSFHTHYTLDMIFRGLSVLIRIWDPTPTLVLLTLPFQRSLPSYGHISYQKYNRVNHSFVDLTRNAKSIDDNLLQLLP